jgi:RNA polymerase sigma-70 factor (ECF subfamily)
MLQDNESDRDLVGRCTAGDPRAWEEFLRRYRRLAAYAIRETFRRAQGRIREEDVDDVIEEVYKHLIDQDFRVLRSLKEPYNLKAWVAIVARRKARDHLRKRTIAPVSLDQPVADGLRVAPLGRLLGLAAAPSDESAEEVRRALEEASLNPKERLMISLYYFKEKSYADVAAIVGVPENSIGPTIRRALEKVKETLEKRGWVS